MMLIIGGAFQGKKEYALTHFQYSPSDIGDGGLIPVDQMLNYKVIDNFHLTIGKIYETGENIDNFICKLFESERVEIVISDEVGSGIVPIEEKERELRDIIGKTLIKIAARAEKVIRVSCGLPLTIK